MATVAARGSGTPATTGTTWAALTNAVDGTAGTNPATYATMTNATASAVATIEVTNYGFSTTIASVDTLNSVSVTVRHFENNTGRFASVQYQAFDGATAIGTAETATLGTAAANATATFPVTLAQIRSATFKVRVTVTGAASTQSRVFSLDHVDVTADYTPLPPTITQATYRWFDEGTETGAVALAAQDTAATGDVTINDGIGQLRVRLQSTNAGVIAATDDWQLQWEKNSSGTWSNVIGTGAEGLADSYAATNQSFQIQCYSVAPNGACQSFLGDGKHLVRSRFWLRNVGTPTGSLTAQLWSHTGTFGSGGKPGALLATSTTSRAVSTLTTSYAWYSFDFTGYSLATGTPYCIALIASGGTGPPAGNHVEIGNDISSQTHPGNHAGYGSATWNEATADLIFEVYTAPIGSTALPYNSPNLTDGAATTNRLGAGTGSFIAGKVSETGVVTDLGWSANNYSELLWSLALQKADLANGNTLRFRVLRNGATTGLTYTQTPTINVVAAAVPINGTATGSITVDGAASGQKDVTGTASGSVDVAGTAAGVAAPASNDVTGTAVGSLAVTGTAAGQVTTVGLATGTLAVTGTASGQVTTLGQATGQLALVGTATGQKTVRATATGSVALDATATGQKTVTATATGQVQVAGSGSGLKAGAGNGAAVGSLTVTGLASGVRTTRGVATGSVALSSTVNGQVTVTATATGSLSLSGAASGVKSVRGVAAGQVVLTSVALGQVEGNAVGRAAGNLTVTGLVTGRRGRPGTATGQFTVTGLATGVRGRPGTATGTLSLVGLSTGRVNRPVTGHAAGVLTVDGTVLGRRSTTGTAAGQVVIVGTARGSGPEVTIGMWNGAEFVLMQYEHSEVVDWMLTPA